MTRTFAWRTVTRTCSFFPSRRRSAAGSLINTLIFYASLCKRQALLHVYLPRPSALGDKWRRIGTSMWQVNDSLTQGLFSFLKRCDRLLHVVCTLAVYCGGKENLPSTLPPSSSRSPSLLQPSLRRATLIELAHTHHTSQQPPYHTQHRHGPKSKPFPSGQPPARSFRNLAATAGFQARQAA
jgi:hypothetical protein